MGTLEVLREGIEWPGRREEVRFTAELKDFRMPTIRGTGIRVRGSRWNWSKNGGGAMPRTGAQQARMPVPGGSW